MAGPVQTRWNHFHWRPSCKIDARPDSGVKRNNCDQTKWPSREQKVWLNPYTPEADNLPLVVEEEEHSGNHKFYFLKLCFTGICGTYHDPLLWEVWRARLNWAMGNTRSFCSSWYAHLEHLFLIIAGTLCIALLIQGRKNLIFQLNNSSDKHSV